MKAVVYERYGPPDVLEFRGVPAPSPKDNEVLNPHSRDDGDVGQVADAGAFTPGIGRHYPFEQVIEAHRYVDSGRKRGNVVITVW
jgi:NADPH:quinone reductase-like Zn-dependent oxidoreductase